MTRRIHSLDALRLTAVILVVAQHAAIFLPEGTTTLRAFVLMDGLTRWNIPALFLISGYLAGRRTRVCSGRVGVGHVGRLLVPYAFWGTVYTVIFGVQAYSQGVPIHLPDLVDVLTGGGVYFILWFLPMLAYCTLIGAAFRDRLRCLMGAVGFLIGWSALVAVFAGRLVPSYTESGGGFLFYLPFFVGIYLSAKWLGLRDEAHSLPSVRPLTALTVFFLTANALWGLANPEQGVALQDACGLCLAAAIAVMLVLFALRFPLTAARMPAFWRSTAPLGIYLTHMLVLEITARATQGIQLVWYLSWPVLTAAGILGAALLVGALTLVRPMRMALGVAALRKP